MCGLPSLLPQNCPGLLVSSAVRRAGGQPTWPATSFPVTVELGVVFTFFFIIAIIMFNPHWRVCLLVLEREEGRGKEKHRSVASHLYLTGTQPTAQVHALTRNRTCHPLVPGTRPNQQSRPARAGFTCVPGGEQSKAEQRVSNACENGRKLKCQRPGVRLQQSSSCAHLAPVGGAACAPTAEKSDPVPALPGQTHGPCAIRTSLSLLVLSAP